MTPDKQTQLGWRRKDWCREFGCGISFSYKLQQDRIIETHRLGPKMTIITTPPAEALKKAAEAYAAASEAAVAAHRARIKAERRAKRAQAAA